MSNDKQTSRSLEDNVVLWGPSGSFVPVIEPPQERETKALNLFQSFLCNSDDEAAGYGNVITLWEMIPKYTGEYLNKLEHDIPNDFKRDFQIHGTNFTLTLFPGTYYPNRKSAKPARRYPGAREQLVEQAILQLACSQARAEETNGEVSYYIYFSIREIAKILKEMGSTHSNTQIRESLEILSSSIMTLTIHGSNSSSSRNPIIPSFKRTESSDNIQSGKDVWKIEIHPLVTHAIKNVGYRQFPFCKGKKLAPFGGYLLRQMYYAASNISEDNPFVFRLSELQDRTPGLTHVTVRARINAVERELKKMVDSGEINGYETDLIFPKRNGMGRPAPVDAAFTLHPSSDLVKGVKAGSKRVTVTEKSLGLLRSQRQIRQMTLPLL